MLDIRIETFLSLCETKSYTKTAQNLNITQPTVTQHIQYLEKKYRCRLVNYSGKSLKLTEKGEKLKLLALAMKANNFKIEQDMLKDTTKNPNINFGSTLTIGEYVMPEKIAAYLNQCPNTNITMLVDNTEVLLKKLEEGLIDFAIIEGYFDKDRYGYTLVKTAAYIGVCGQNHSLAQKKVTFDELLQERLIVREKGSGTRDILETLLHEHNLSIDSFQSKLEIGNFNAIKELVINGLGITFVYQEVVEKELRDSRLHRLNIHGFHIKRKFNIVYLKEDVLLEKYRDFWNYVVE